MTYDDVISSYKDNGKFVVHSKDFNFAVAQTVADATNNYFSLYINDDNGSSCWPNTKGYSRDDIMLNMNIIDGGDILFSFYILRDYNLDRLKEA